MESAAVFRSFNCTISNAHSVLERPCFGKSSTQVAFLGKLVSSPTKWNKMVVSCVKTSENSAAISSEEDIVTIMKFLYAFQTCIKKNQTQGSLEKKTPLSAKFPNGFETLVQDVCDKTEIAELKLKIGDFEMLVRRNMAPTPAPTPVVSTMTLPVAGETRTEPAVSTPPSPPKPAEKTSPFTNASVPKSSKLAALEASGSGAFVLVSSPTVGSFRKGRTMKGKKLPPICKEGAVIKEGQVIGYVDQFGTEHPVKSDVAGEVLKVLFDEGEAVGYGDPLVAVLPSFMA